MTDFSLLLAILHIKHGLNDERLADVCAEQGMEVSPDTLKRLRTKRTKQPLYYLGEKLVEIGKQYGVTE